MSAGRKRAGGLEVHEHCFITGPRAHGPRYKFAHSHEGGDRYHRHPNTGPSAFTIDKDEWRRSTGMQGGGRKTFTVKPTGEQLPLEAVPKEERVFKVIVVGDGRGGLPPEQGEGPGLAPAIRAALTFDMDFTVEHVDDDGSPARKRVSP